jgi:TM2 domain-containing membrane protein YozV
MANGNDGNDQGGSNDWQNGQGRPQQGQPQQGRPQQGQQGRPQQGQPPQGQPQQGQPPEPEDWQSPGAQGPREPQGGEWSGGHANEQTDQAWGEGPGHPQGGQVQQPQLDQPPARQQQSTKPKLENNDIIAIVISIFFPGVGQMMLGQTTKGIVVLLVTFFTCAVGGLLPIAAALDAYCVAMAKKKRPVDEWEFFPDMNDAF